MKLLLVSFVFASALSAQYLNNPIFPLYTVSTLPPAASVPNVSLQVRDSLSGSCSVGGGTVLIMCRSISGVWTPQGAAGGLNQLTGDVTAGPGTGSQVASLAAIKGVPFCTGFSPTNGQVTTYDTVSSPNPCWSAQNQFTSIDGVPFCNGYSPTTGQAPTYTTTSSPNPCYIAQSVSGGGNLSTSGSPAIYELGVYASGTTLAGIVPSSTVGQPLVSEGPSAYPAYAALNLAGGSSIVTGAVPPANGGTGIANGTNNTITFSGNFTLGLTLSANTSLTLPTSGTLVNSSVTALNSLSSANGTAIPASSTLTQTVCSGTVALGTSAIASGAAATTVTATCTGLASTDNIELDFNGSPLAVTGYVPSANGMLTVIRWPSSNTINVSVINNTASSITPGAITLNYRVVR